MAENSLPPIKTLFSESWERLKGSVTHLIVIYIISLLLFFALFIIGLLITVPLGAFSLFSTIQNNGLTPAFFSSIGILGIVVLILLVAAVVIGTMIQAALIIIVANYRDKPSYKTVLKQGLGFVWPLILAGILSGFIVSGGYFLFVIPGIAFGLFFMFVNMEIVLNKQDVIPALRRSMGIVLSNFWGILGRVLIFFIIAIPISMVPQILASGTKNAGVAGLFEIISAVINVMVGWYGISYSITLYKQASKSYIGSGSKLMWPVITSIVGWIAGIIFIASITALVFSLINNTVVSKGTNSSQFNKELEMMLDNPSSTSDR
jgi:hypothetical protein